MWFWGEPVPNANNTLNSIVNPGNGEYISFGDNSSSTTVTGNISFVGIPIESIEIIRNNYAGNMIFTTDADPTLFSAQPCYAGDTIVHTPDGKRQIKDINIGDKVKTCFHGFQEVLWVGSRTISSKALKARPNLRPIIIRANSCGEGMPATDLKVSRQHRIYVNSKIAQKLFNHDEVLIPAIKLVGIPGIEIDNSLEDVTYVHIICDEHQIIFANGLPAETLYLGKNAAKTLTKDAYNEIFEIFPELVQKRVKPAAFIPKKLCRTSKLRDRHMQDSSNLINM